MKKLIALLLILVTVFSLAACAFGDSSKKDTIYDAENLAEALEDEGYDISFSSKKKEIKNFFKNSIIDTDEMEMPIAIIEADKSSGKHAIQCYVFEDANEARLMNDCVDDMWDEMREYREEAADDQGMDLDEFLEEYYGCDSWDEYVKSLFYEYGCNGNVFYIVTSKKALSALEDALEASLENDDDDDDDDDDDRDWPTISTGAAEEDDRNEIQEGTATAPSTPNDDWYEEDNYYDEDDWYDEEDSYDDPYWYDEEDSYDGSYWY